MLRLLSLILLSICLLSQTYAQNWQMVNSSRVSHFTYDKNSDTTLVESISIDSVRIVNGDSIFQNFQTFYGNISTTCENFRDTSWLGIRVILKPDMTHLFITKTMDTIVIHPYDTVGASWNSGIGTALISSADIQPILPGISDSVKTITIGTMQIRTSKNFGLIDGYRFAYLPTEKTPLTLFSIEGVYEPLHTHLDVGDEFHYVSTFYENFMYPTIVEKEIETIIGKTTSGSVTYHSVKRCWHRKQVDFGSGVEYSSGETGFLLTLSPTPKVGKSFLSTADSSAISSQNGGYQYYFNDSAYNGRFQHYTEYEYVFSGNDCWHQQVDGGGYSITAEDLGPVLTVNNSLGRHIRELVYFRKADGEEWGAPLGTCETLSTEESAASLVHVYPNPAKNHLFLSGLERNQTISITNATGQEVIQFMASGNQQQLDISDLPNGLYTVRISTNQGLFATERLIIAR